MYQLSGRKPKLLRLYCTVRNVEGPKSICNSGRPSMFAAESLQFQFSNALKKK